MRIVLTGSTGFVGRHLLPALRAAGHTLGLLTRAPTDAADLMQIGMIDSPIRIPASQLESAVALFCPEAVINLATCYGRSESLAEVLEANVSMPLRLFAASAAAGCTMFIQTDTFFSKPEFDYDHLRPYIHTKREFLWWAQEFLRTRPTQRLVNMRLEHVYGSDDKPDKFVPQLLAALTRPEPAEFTTADQQRDFVHVRDVVDAFLAVLADAHAPSGFTEHEVGTGRTHSLRQFIETCRTLSGSSTELRFGARPQRSGEIMRSQANTSSLQQLGWRPRMDLAQGLADVIAAHVR